MFFAERMEEEKEEVGEGEGRLSGYNLKTTNRFISNTICYIDTLFFFILSFLTIIPSIHTDYQEAWQGNSPSVNVTVIYQQ